MTFTIDCKKHGATQAYTNRDGDVYCPECYDEQLSTFLPSGKKVVYSKEDYSRSGAWDIHTKLFPSIPSNHWRKAHSLTHWGWREVDECSWYLCPVCRPKP